MKIKDEDDNVTVPSKLKEKSSEPVSSSNHLSGHLVSPVIIIPL